MLKLSNYSLQELNAMDDVLAHMENELRDHIFDFRSRIGEAIMDEEAKIVKQYKEVV